LVLVLVLAACSSQALPTPAPAPVARAPLARSAQESTACARSVLNSFIDAFNRGDSAQLSTFFSRSQGAMTFQWFVTPETPAYGPGIAQLPDYFATWRAAGERWRLVSVDAGASPSWHGGVDFGMEIERTWPDRSVINPGKGALDCDAGKIFVFGLGDAISRPPSGGASR
jgi:hypothetical protein